MYQTAPNYHHPFHKPPVVALLLDAENIASTHLDFVVDKASKYGALLIRRAYADWSLPPVSSYRKGLKQHAFFSVHQFSGYSGKNSSDMALSVDAMDLVYNRKPDIVVLATSDNDFTPLVIKLREMGVVVVGIGNPNVAKGLVGACNDFHYIPILPKPTSPPPKSFAPEYGSAQKSDEPRFATPTPNQGESKAVKHPPNAPSLPTRTTPITPLKSWQKDPNKDQAIINVIEQMLKTKADEYGRVNLATVGSAFNANKIDMSNYGFDKVASMIACMHDFEITAVDSTYYMQRRQVTPVPVPYDDSVLNANDAPLDQKALDIAFVNALAGAISIHQDEYGWAKVGQVAIAMRQQSGIMAGQYGYKTLSDAIMDSDMFELYQGDKGDYVRDVRTLGDGATSSIPAEFVQADTNAKTVPPTPKSQADTTIADQSSPISGANSQAPSTTNKHKKQPLTASQITQLRTAIHKIMEGNTDNLEWLSLGVIGAGLRKSGVEPKQYGAKNFSALIEKMGCFETNVFNTVLCLKNPYYVSKTPKTHESMMQIDDVNDEVADDVAHEEMAYAVGVDDVNQDNANELNNDDTEADEVPSDDIDTNVDDIELGEDEEADTMSIDVEDEPDTVISDDDAEEESEFSLSDLLALINQAIATHQNYDGYAKVGDIGKFVRNAIGLGAQSFGYDDFGKMLALFPQYEVVRIGRFVMVKVKDE